MRNLFGLGLMMMMVALFAACNNNAVETKNDLGEKTEADAVETRGMAETKALAYYRSLASAQNALATFQEGKSAKDIKLGSIEDKNVNLVVLYDASIAWAAVFNSGDVKKTGDEGFNSLLGKFNLAIVKQFELDSENEGLVLEPNAKMADPVQAAREISMIDGVLMVHVKEASATAEETAVND
jgi:hypothetical protein